MISYGSFAQTYANNPIMTNSALKSYSGTAASTEPRVSVVVLNWCGFDDTIKCLESLYSSSFPLTSIVVVDNASPDGSGDLLAEWLREKSGSAESSVGLAENLGASVEYRCPATPTTCLIRSPENGGYSAGNNIGIKYALKRFGVEFVLLLNNDAEVDRGAISAMLATAAVRRSAVTAPVILYKRSNNKIWFCGGWRLLGVAFHRHRGKELSVTMRADRPITFATGCALLVRRDVFETIGYLDERFFMYGEDIDYSLRVSRAYCIWLSGQAIVFHAVDDYADLTHVNHLAAYYGRRNQRFLAGGGLVRRILFIIVDAGLVILPSTVRCWLNGRLWSRSLTLMLRGAWSALVNRDVGKVSGL
jgi:GT2 family glycosyltransferase